MSFPSRRVVQADASEAQPGYRFWRISLDPMSDTQVTVTGKSIADNAIDSAELRDLLSLSQTPEIFAAMLLGRTEEIVAEPMPAHVSNGLRRQIVEWYGDNRKGIAELLRDQGAVQGG